MPKDEFDFDDPLQLNGVALLTDEDTTDAMCECFIEEFMRMGHGPERVLALFWDPHYLGMNLILEKRGEQFVRDAIAEVYARRGKTVRWLACDRHREDARSPVTATSHNAARKVAAPAGAVGSASPGTHPLGAPVPNPNL